MRNKQGFSLKLFLYMLLGGFIIQLLATAKLAEAANLRQKTNEPTAFPTPNKETNLIFVISDDQSATAIPPYVSEDHPMYDPKINPRWSQSVESSFTFFQSRTKYTVCGPSRASLTTGRNPETIGIFTFHRLLPQAAKKLATFFGFYTDHGYATQTIGKIFHQEPSLDYTQMEFDTGQTNMPHISTQAGNSDCGNKWYCNKSGGLADDDVLDKTKKFLNNWLANPDRPFAIGVGFHRPHLEDSVPPEFLKLLKNYLPKGFVPTIPNTTDWLHSLAHRSANDLANMKVLIDNRWQRILSGNTKSMDDFLTNPSKKEIAAIQKMIKYYLAASRYNLDNIAQMVQFVDAHPKLSESTHIVITGDHGWTTGEYGNLAGKNNLGEPAVKVPLAIRRAKQPGAPIQVPMNYGLASSIDIFPTVVHLTHGLGAVTELSDDLGHLHGNTLVPGLYDANYNANPNGVATQYQRCQPRGSIQTLDCMTNINANTCSLPTTLWMGHRIETTNTNDGTGEILVQWYKFNDVRTGCAPASWYNMSTTSQKAARTWPAWSQIDPNKTGTDWSKDPVEQEYYHTINHTRVSVNLAFNPVYQQRIKALSTQTQAINEKQIRKSYGSRRLGIS